MDSVRTALKVFEIVAQQGEAGLAEVMRAVGAPKSTVQRGLTTLHEAGWLRPAGDGTRRRWVPSARLLTLLRGQADLVSLRLRAIPVLERLRAATQETMHMTVRDGDRMVLIERLDSPRILRTGWPLGSSTPLHIGSNGKAVLACQSDNAIDAYIARGLSAWTEQSIVDPAALRQDILHIRRRGYAVSDRELDVEVRSVAAAIIGSDRRAAAALSISCPASRLSADLVAIYGPLVREAANELAMPGDVGAERPAAGRPHLS